MPERTYNRLYIGGEGTGPHSGRVIESIDPATETVWGEADDTDVDRTVTATHHYTEVKTVVADFDDAPPADPFANRV